MKTPHTEINALIVTCALLMATPLGHASPGGPLNPPAAPGVIYKTLDEVEPRIPISSLPYTITQCGSYYLTDCLTGSSGQNGIDIRADNVTVDLMGFTIFGVAGSYDGIHTTGNRTNIAIYNGVVRDWGNDGIDLSSAYNSQLRDLRTSNNLFEGMQVGRGGIVSGCTSQGNGQDGIDAGNGCTISGCSVFANTGDGIVVADGCTVSRCTASGNNGDGIQALTDCQILNNTCDGNGAGTGSGAGINVNNQDNTIVGNSLTDNDRGLDINAANNYVADNTVRRNSDNYDIVAGNQLNILLGQLPESIDWPAQVVLAGSLTGTASQNGVTINSSDVTIDLGGHALVGLSNAWDGIRVSGIRTNITIRNGTIRGWGQDGVDATTAYNSALENINVSDSGARGVALGQGGTISSCNARANQGNGIVISSGCRVSNSSSSYNQGHGIDMSTASTAIGCAAYNNEGVGIDASTGCVVSQCTSYSNTGYGINASSATTVDDCAVSSNSTNGIACSNGAKVTGCAVRANSGNGIYVTGGDAYIFNNTVDGHSGDAGILVASSDNRIDSNNLTDNTRGIEVTSSGNLIIRNSVATSTTAYDIAAGNTVGTIYGVADPISNSLGPWANFSY